MNKNTVIFYYSQSGNSLYAAKKLASKLGNTTLVSIPKAMRNNEYRFIDYERVGFCIPLYFMGMPKTVNEFIAKLEIPKESYVFCIITRASSKGRIIYDIDKLLSKRGSKVNYGKYLSLPDSYIRWLPVNSKEKRFKMFKNAEKFLDSAYNEILCKREYKEKEGFIYRLCSLLVYSVWRRRLKSLGKKFKVDRNLCTGCGICEKTCPAGNITLVNGKPSWSDKCEDCMACVQHCPKKAIYFNSRTIKKERYMNPNVKLDELIY